MDFFGGSGSLIGGGGWSDRGCGVGSGMIGIIRN